MGKLYSAVLTSGNKISVFNIRTGVRSYTISLGNVTVVNGPIVTADKLTIVVKTTQDKMQGRVYSLKSGVLSYSFFVK